MLCNSGLNMLTLYTILQRYLLWQSSSIMSSLQFISLSFSNLTIFVDTGTCNVYGT